MELEYTQNDLKSAFEFGKKYPNLKLKDWFKYEKTQLTKEEQKLFKFIDVATVPIGKSKLFFMNWNGVGGGHFSEPFKIFKRKYFNKYYQFFNNCSGEFSVIVTGEDFFNLKTFDKTDYEGVYVKEIIHNDVKITIMNYIDFDGDKDEHQAHMFYSWRNTLERNNYHFWQMANWDVYIDKPYNLNVTPALELLEKKIIK